MENNLINIDFDKKLLEGDDNNVTTKQQFSKNQLKKMKKREYWETHKLEYRKNKKVKFF
jgi:hypothetical protein